MPAFLQLLALAALTSLSPGNVFRADAETLRNKYGHLEKRLVPDANCSDAQLVHNTTIDIGDHTVYYSGFLCGSDAVALHFGGPFGGHDEHGGGHYGGKNGAHGGGHDGGHHGGKDAGDGDHGHSPPPPPPPPKNVCGVTCSTTCNNLAGSLPPITDDCQIIKDAIQIFAGITAPTFVVDPKHLETLTFGTCSYFFSNTGKQQLEYCWSDLSVTASSAGSACFPPIQPLNSEGLCASADGTWAVGAAHS